MRVLVTGAKGQLGSECISVLRERECDDILSTDIDTLDKVNRVTASNYLKSKPNQTLRPLNTRLSKKLLDDAGFRRLPNWEDALRRYIEILYEESSDNRI